MATGWKKDYFRYKDFFLNIITLYKVKPNLAKYLELILSIVTIAMFAIFAIRPTVLTIIELNKEIKEKEETVTKLTQKIKNLQIASNILSKEDRLPTILQAVPDRANPETFVKQLESLATSNSLSITSLSASDVSLIGKSKQRPNREGLSNLEENANELPFTITVSGSYKNLFAFTQSIQNLRRPIQIDSYAINSNFIEDQKVLSLMISGRVPFLLKGGGIEEEVVEEEITETSI